MRAEDWSKPRLDALVEEATVDAYDEYEQTSAFHAMLEEHLAIPFVTLVLGVEVTVERVGLFPGSGIVGVCARDSYRQAIGILDLPLPTPEPAGTEWIAAYRHWSH
ncbi:hypothetical protein QNO07_18990 [Streptomyces sp. 549]|uniref:hypothetical protein n=1 Tax=Streptomyces sp. 549 TaxID=3049076 RepID=UPI0024C3CB64|nr:hypothetical protein [Streptomyces sp. 549]MDK1475480.1 hypothetical protein [Streptomyces sp. 549]